jgi:uroporphyrinogen decarboxylase
MAEVDDRFKQMENDRFKAMRFQHPKYIPISAGVLPAVWMRYREALQELVKRHPIIFGEEGDNRDFDAVSIDYAAGDHTDEWGCVWSNIHEGCAAYVSGNPLPERAMVNSLQLPKPGGGIPHGLMFLRLIYLRGYEEAMLDFAEEPPELQRMIDIVLEYNLGEINRLLADKPNMLYFGDDLGTQKALPISPVKWRKYMKPCFQQMFKVCHDAGCAVYLHTDGHIVPIMKDLIECGVDVLNPQIGANGLDNIVSECKGKVCVNLDLNRQMFPFWSAAEIDAHVKEAVEKLGAPEGGLWLLAEIGPELPLETIEAICQALEKYRGYYRKA